MLLRILLVLAVAALGMPTLAQAADATRHTGIVVAVQADQRGITLEEMGPWTGPSHGQVRRSVALTPETTVLVVTRAEQAAAGGWPGGFSATPLAHSAIRAGDYVTATTESRKGKLVALSIEVLRPTPEPAGR
jgi:hypothetical protein